MNRCHKGQVRKPFYNLDKSATWKKEKTELIEPCDDKEPQMHCEGLKVQKCEVMKGAVWFCYWESKWVSRQVKPPKTMCKQSFSSQEEKDDYLTITRPQRREKPHCLGDGKRDYMVAAVLMMMGKGKNTAVHPRGYTKLQQLAEVCGTWLKHWQCTSKWKMKRECLICC